MFVLSFKSVRSSSNTPCVICVKSMYEIWGDVWTQELVAGGIFLTDVFMVRLLLFVDFVGINQECLYTDPLIIHLTNIIVWESQPLIQVLTAGLQYPLNAASWDLIFILHHLSVAKPEKDNPVLNLRRHIDISSLKISQIKHLIPSIAKQPWFLWQLESELHKFIHSSVQFQSDFESVAKWCHSTGFILFVPLYFNACC